MVYIYLSKYIVEMLGICVCKRFQVPGIPRYGVFLRRVTEQPCNIKARILEYVELVPVFLQNATECVDKLG